MSGEEGFEGEGGHRPFDVRFLRLGLRGWSFGFV